MQIPTHPYRILIVGDSRLGKMNAQLNSINHQPGIDKIYLYAKNSYESKHQLVIIKWQDVGLKHFKDLKAFIQHSSDMNDAYKSIEEYNSGKEWTVLIVLDDMIADMISNKKFQPVVIELFIRGRKLNISLLFIT